MTDLSNPSAIRALRDAAKISATVVDGTTVISRAGWWIAECETAEAATLFAAAPALATALADALEREAQAVARAERAEAALAPLIAVATDLAAQATLAEWQGAMGVDAADTGDRGPDWHAGYDAAILNLRRALDELKGNPK